RKLFSACSDWFTTQYWNLLTPEEQETLAVVGRRGPTLDQEEDYPALPKLAGKQLIVYSDGQKRWGPFCTLFRHYTPPPGQDSGPAAATPKLTQQEEAIWAYLRDHPNATCSIEDLYAATGREPSSSPNFRERVHSIMHNLKEKLPSRTAALIVSHRSRGYR